MGKARTSGADVTGKSVGRWGETLACDFLQQNGYQLLASNWRVRWLGEIDTVALAPDGQAVVFVEVKTRRTQRFGLPSEAVGFRKQATLVQLAQLYLQQAGLTDRPVRFDVVSVWLSSASEPPHIEHLQNAFDGGTC